MINVFDPTDRPTPEQIVLTLLFGEALSIDLKENYPVPGTWICWIHQRTIEYYGRVLRLETVYHRNGTSSHYASVMWGKQLDAMNPENITNVFLEYYDGPVDYAYYRQIWVIAGQGRGGSTHNENCNG